MANALLSVLFVPFLLFKLFTDTSERYRSRGVFSFIATGDIEGQFTGVARTEHSHSLSSAGQSFMIVLEVPEIAHASLEGTPARLMFVFDSAPVTDVFRVNDSQEPDSIRTPSVRALLLAGHQGSASEIWRGSLGELRLEAAVDDDPGMTGDFSFRFVGDNGFSSTQAAQITGRFETHALGARSTNGLSRFARRLWHTPLIQAVVFLPKLMYFIVGMLLLLVVVSVHQQLRDMRHRR